jgi:hypothetical protein
MRRHRFWSSVVKALGGLWSIGSFDIIVHDDGLVLCRDSVIKREWDLGRITNDPDARGTPPPQDQIRWRVLDLKSNLVTIEFECHDAYDAIELAEICAAGLSEGELILEVSNDE